MFQHSSWEQLDVIWILNSQYQRMKANGNMENGGFLKNQVSTRLITIWLVLQMALMLLAACVPTKPPTTSQIQQNQKALVLIRVVTTDQHGKKGPHWLGLGEAETGGVTEGCDGVGPTCPRTLSDDSRAEGFVYYLLSPGTYSFAVRPFRFAESMFSYLASFQSAPRWLFKVPPKTPIVYAGTLNLHGIYSDGTIRQLYVDRTSITNDEALALKVASKHYPNLRPVSTSLMQRYKP